MLITKPGRDGRDRGAKVVALALALRAAAPPGALGIAGVFPAADSAAVAGSTRAHAGSGA